MPGLVRRTYHPCRSPSRLKLSMSILAFLCSVFLAFADTSEEESTLSADELLSDVVARLPAVPLLITGELHVRRPRGVSVRDLNFEMLVNWGACPAVASYAIKSKENQLLEELTVRRSDGAVPVFSRTAGDPPEEVAVGDLFAPVQETDLSWMDLTLSFLWWTGGELAGEDKIKGRPAFIVDVPAPDGEADSQYASVRLWIDVAARMLLQAEGRTADGTVVRRLWIKSFKKVNEMWMIKDLEVQHYPVRHRTKLRVREVSKAGELINHESDAEH